METYKFIVNPAASGGKVRKMLPWLESRCKNAGISYAIECTQQKGHAQKIARDASGLYTRIVAVGGDGTVHEVINGMIGGTSILGFLPLGSGNDLVRGLGLPFDREDAFDVLIKGGTRFIDLGKMGEIYFHNGISIGFTAEVTYETLRERFFKAKLKYISGILKTLIKYRAPELSLSYNGNLRKDRFLTIEVANGLYMGGGFKLTPAALFDDGELDLNIVVNMSKLKVIRHLLGVLSGNHTRLPEVTQDRTKQIFITGIQAFAVQADGEFLGIDYKSIEISILPKALEIIVSK